MSSSRHVQTSDFDYALPKELIAQTPVEPRDSSLLLVLDRASGSIQHRRFRELVTLLHPNDLLVFNDSKVIPARLHGRKVTNGGRVELLLLHRVATGQWEALVRPGRRIPPNTLIELDGTDHICQVRIQDKLESGSRILEFDDERCIEVCGTTPLPPYIHTPLADQERYQTVYARVSGSAAAPTAGLHFTETLMHSLSSKGIRFAFVTLHVGLDTFRPVKVDHIAQHPIHREYASLPTETAQAINETRARNGRVISIGTTTARVLETSNSPSGKVAPFEGWTSLFITPEHQFRNVDGLVTNFHLPRSTLLMLVTAFAGKQAIDAAYAQAIDLRYRFYSFGDAMFIA